MNSTNPQRILTVTVTEHSWTTYRIPVSPDFDAADYGTLEQVIINAAPGQLYVAESAVEHREITVDSDDTEPQPSLVQSGQRCRDPFREDCRQSLSDGEGFDGVCGSCADRLEAQGHWS